MGDNHSDPDSALGIALRNGIHEDHVLLYPFEGHGRLIRNSGIAEFAICLVRDEEKVMFLDNVAYAQQFLVRIQVAGRIVRVAEQDRPGLRSYGLLEGLDRRKRESVLDI